LFLQEQIKDIITSRPLALSLVLPELFYKLIELETLLVTLDWEYHAVHYYYFLFLQEQIKDIISDHSVHDRCSKNSNNNRCSLLLFFVFCKNK
jgi:hypothetical protein